MFFAHSFVCSSFKSYKFLMRLFVSNIFALSLLNYYIRVRYPASIIYKFIAIRYRPVSYPDGRITARYICRSLNKAKTAVKLVMLVFGITVLCSTVCDNICLTSDFSCTCLIDLQLTMPRFAVLLLTVLTNTTTFKQFSRSIFINKIN